MKTAVVCGAGGFIGSHMVKRLKKEGHWVQGVDVKKPEFADTVADDFLLLDLREAANCELAVKVRGGPADEVYQLAGDMGGVGYIEGAECEILQNSTLINIHVAASAATLGVRRYFFPSSVCVYRDMAPGEPELHEAGSYPAMPNNEYGWEKLYSERVSMAFGRRYGMTVRIARLQNCFGPEGTWRGGREKAPSAIARKIAMAKNGGEIEVWGDGSAVRSYTYIDDTVDGIYRLMQSSLEGPVNIGSPEYVTVDELVNVIGKVSGKEVSIKHVTGPAGPHSRNFSNARIYSLGWRTAYSLADGIALTYPWIEEQVARAGLT